MFCSQDGMGLDPPGRVEQAEPADLPLLVGHVDPVLHHVHHDGGEGVGEADGEQEAPAAEVVQLKARVDQNWRKWLQWRPLYSQQFTTPFSNF